MSTTKKDKDLKSEIVKEIFIYVSILLIFLLSVANINSYFLPKKVKVLGLETDNSNEVFWQNFLVKNPSYIPGWIESGRLDKVKEIDPNYFSR